MFSAVSCRLSLLCDEALRDDLRAEEVLPPPSPGDTRRLQGLPGREQKVTFDGESPHVRYMHSPVEYACHLDVATAIANLLIPEGTEEECSYDRCLNARLNQAYFNQQRNTKVFRYGEPSPTIHKKQTSKYGTLYAGRAKVYWGQSISQAGAYQSRETEGEAIGRKWWQDMVVHGTYPRTQRRRRYCDDQVGKPGQRQSEN